MGNLSRNNHYIPKFYLKNWGVDNKIWEMQLLVPNENIPVWRHVSIKKTAVQKNLYIISIGEGESDEFESWINKKFETPVQDAFFRAIDDRQLTPEDWKKLIDFLAVMSMRTPARIAKEHDRLVKILPGILDKFVADFSLKGVEEITNEVKAFSDNPKAVDKYFPIKLKIDQNPTENGNDFIEIGLIAGKGLHLWEMEFILTSTAKILHQHRWSIITIADGMTWSTSDDPVMCINYHDLDDYDFEGGWNKAGCDIFFPISPTKALYSEVWKRHACRFTLSIEMSRIFQKMIIKHAHRKIYSLIPDSKIETIRSRKICLEAYKEEESQWEKFHQDHIEIENDYYRKHK